MVEQITLKEGFANITKEKFSATKSRIPFVLIYYEAYKVEKDAISREKQIKSGSERERIKKILKNTLSELKGSVA